MNSNRLEIIGFIILLALALVLVLMMFFPFFKLLALAGILAVLFQPLYKKIRERFQSETIGSIASIVIILLIVLVPMYVMSHLLFREIFGFYQQYRHGGEAINPASIVHNLPESWQPLAQSLNQDLGNRFSSLATNAFKGATDLFTNVAGFVLSFFLVFFSLYFFLRDGKKIKEYFNNIFPLSTAHENKLIEKLESAVSGVITGSFLVALVQGVIGTAGYLIFGVPGALLWGMFTVLAALVPNVGTLLAWLPAVLYLFIVGHTGQAVGLLLWSVLLTGTVDNIISPRLVGGRVKLHPLLVLLSVFGGLRVFGFIGFLLGPIVTAVFVTLLDIYRKDLKGYLEK